MKESHLHTTKYFLFFSLFFFKFLIYFIFKIKRVVVPQALRVLRLRPGRRFCSVGRLAHEVGWKYQDTIKALEQKRTVRAAAYHERKKALTKLANKATEQSKQQFSTPLLQKTGL